MSPPIKGLPTVEALVTFLSAEEGGRQTPLRQGALSGDSYRPHLVIGDPNQRKAIQDGNRILEEYLGITFHSGPNEFKVGEQLRVDLTLLFYPHPQYDKLKSGVTFTVREGSRIVAYGSVTRGVELTPKGLD